jgi:hypothetical protein
VDNGVVATDAWRCAVDPPQSGRGGSLALNDGSGDGVEQVGYSTYFWGQVPVQPPLNRHEREYLTRFAATRRMASTLGPYYVGRSGVSGQDHTADVINDHQPPYGQPNLWCQWAPNPSGTALTRIGGDKFYDPLLWMQYLIDHFLRPDALASRGDRVPGSAAGCPSTRVEH